MTTVTVLYCNLFSWSVANKIATSLKETLRQPIKVKTEWNFSIQDHFVISIQTPTTILEAVLWQDVHDIIVTVAPFVSTNQTIECRIKNGNAFSLTQRVYGTKGETDERKDDSSV
jgi:hypothetical protein